MKPPMDHKIKRPNGEWVPSGQTDIRNTFERIRQRQEVAKAMRAEKQLRVIAITRKA
jgi:hypothetical protein